LKNNKVFYCIECNSELPSRYKGRQRIYCGNLCRKAYTTKHPKVKKDEV